MKKKADLKINPLFIKNEAGKTVGIYLDTKTYRAMMKEVAKFEKLKKDMKRKQGK